MSTGKTPSQHRVTLLRYGSTRRVWRKSPQFDFFHSEKPVEIAQYPSGGESKFFPIGDPDLATATPLHMVICSCGMFEHRGMRNAVLRAMHQHCDNTGHLEAA